MVDELNTNCQKNYQLGQKISLDEVSPGYSGRTTYKRRTKHKKVPSALQAFSIADGSTGYLWQFEFVFDNQARKNTPKGLTKTQAAVLRLTDTLQANWHTLIMDNYFNSPLLVYRAMEKKQMVMGTWRSTYGMPSLLKQPKLSGKALEAAKKAEPLFTICNEIIDSGVAKEIPIILRVSMYCSSLVTMITSERFEFTEQQKGGTKNSMKYEIQHQYNLFMNGVDTSDQLVTYFSTYVRSKKWWKRLFYYMLDVALTNSFICWTNFERGSHREFLEDLAFELLDYAQNLERDDMEEDTHTPHPAPAPVEQWRLTSRNQRPDIRLEGNHEKLSRQKRKRCALCWLHNINKTADSFCPRCSKALCSKDCWNLFHSKEDLLHQ